jgi:hypothetical protein
MHHVRIDYHLVTQVSVRRFTQPTACLRSQVTFLPFSRSDGGVGISSTITVFRATALCLPTPRAALCL